MIQTTTPITGMVVVVFTSAWIGMNGLFLKLFSQRFGNQV